IFCLYSAPCVIFGKSEKDKTFIHTSVNDRSNLGQYIKRYIASSSNHHGCSLLAGNYLDVKSGTKGSISSSVADHVKLIDILVAIIEVLVLCGKQDIPIRGHTEKRSNFLAILKSRAIRHPILMKRILFCEIDDKDKNNEKDSSDSTSCGIKDNRKIKYTSPDIQNELHVICENQIQGTIVQNCNAAMCFGLIADECTDKSTKEKVSICLRFVQYDSTKDNYEVQFLTFVHATETTGEALAQLLLSTPDCLGIKADKMRTQSYDGTAAMSGKHKGVQTSIRQQIPVAKLSAYGVVIHVLEYLRDNGDEKAGQHFASIMKFDFLNALFVAEDVLENTVPLSLHLQAVHCDMLVALDESRTIVRQFQNERADPYD
ncbi:LOW QUALITY PROTEIN: hypothetical protein KUTeg_022196, partial [Tegillarca granosa]